MLSRRPLLPQICAFPRSSSEIIFGSKPFLFTEIFCSDLVDLVEKEWEKLRNGYSRVNRELREKNVLGAGTVSLKNAKQKMGEPNFISWIEAFIKLKQSRGIHTSIKNHEKQEQTFEDTLKA